MNKLIVLLMTILLGCSSAQFKPTVTNDTVTSNYPKLMVQIHKDLPNKGKKKHTWYWQAEGGEGIAVRIEKSSTWMRAGYSYYSLEQILTNNNYFPILPIFINDHKWMEFAYVNINDFLHTGYFTRKEDYFIKEQSKKMS